MDYRIDELSARSGVRIDTIRFYQGKGLLPPPRRDGRIAIYSEEHLDRLRQIRRLLADGLSLQLIRRVLDAQDSGGENREPLISALVAKAIYDRYGVFNPDYKYAMDVDLFARWMKAGVKIAYAAIPLARMQTGGASSKYIYRGFQEKRKAFINNGFPSLVTYVHYISLFGVQLVVMIQQWLRRKTAKWRSTSI